MRLMSFCSFAVAGAALSCPSALGAGSPEVERGAYLTKIMVCADCHSPQQEIGGPDMKRAYSGGLGFEIPGMGIFWAPNLTPDETGLKDWSEDDIVKALRTGERPDGRMLAPIMPVQFFSALTDEDAYAIAAYLKSLAPIANKVPDPVSSGEDATAPYLSMIVPNPESDT